MTTTLPRLPDVGPPPPPAHLADTPPVAPELAAYRRRLRRRLVLFSLPGVIVVVVVALKLLSLPVIAALTQATYNGRDFDRSLSIASTLGFADITERWVHPFDEGTALARIGVLTDARDRFQDAMALAPAGNDAVQCRIRTDLALVVEQQGDSAVLDGDTTAAAAFYKQALAVIAAAPTGCFTSPDSSFKPPSAAPLNDEKARLEQKQQQQPQQGGQQPGGGSSGGQSQGGQGQQGQGSGQGDSGQGASGSGTDPLDKLKQQNGQAQQDQQQNNDRQRYFGQNPKDYSGRPW